MHFSDFEVPRGSHENSTFGDGTIGDRRPKEMFGFVYPRPARNIRPGSTRLTADRSRTSAARCCPSPWPQYLWAVCTPPGPAMSPRWRSWCWQDISERRSPSCPWRVCPPNSEIFQKLTRNSNLLLYILTVKIGSWEIFYSLTILLFWLKFL